MKCICAVCQKYYADKDGPDNDINHGLCPICGRAYKDQLRGKNRYLKFWNETPGSYGYVCINNLTADYLKTLRKNYSFLEIEIFPEKSKKGGNLHVA